MNRVTRTIKAFLARRIARKMETRARRFRRSLRDEHREAMRSLRNADRRARGLRLFAAWSNPKCAVVAGRPILVLGYSSTLQSRVDGSRAVSGTPYPLELATANASENLLRERPVAGIMVRAEFNERTVLIDLNEVDSIESERIAMFIEWMNVIAARGSNLAIFGVREDVRRVFKATRIDEVLRIFSTREEALACQD